MIRTISERYESPEIKSLSNEFLLELQDEIVEQFGGLITEVAKGDTERSVLTEAIERLICAKRGIVSPETVIKKVMDNIFGYGWLQKYVDSPEVTDIDMLRYDSVMVRKKGSYDFVESEFENEKQFTRFCKFIVTRNGGALNEANPYCRVADSQYKLRINVAIPPRNATGPSLTIRKHSEFALHLQDLKELGMIDKDQQLRIIEACRKKRNILICGKGAAGKTTLLRAIIDQASDLERILVCEKDAEIFPEKKNCIVQRISKKEGIKDLNTLVEEGLTMSLDTYCIGEITGKEAWPLVKAGFSDHRCLATIHAQSAEDAIKRMLMLSIEDNLLSEKVVKDMILRSLDIIIYIRSFRVEEIYELRKEL